MIPSLLIAGGSAGAQETESPRFEPVVFESSRGDTVRAELGRFHVPLNRARGGTEGLELAFVRFPATTPDPGPPIVYLAGGPGGSGVATARGSRFPLFMAFRAFGDVIAFDQRGTGMSEGPSPEGCDITRRYPEGRPLHAAHLRHFTLQAARACGEMWREAGVDLSAYNTRESADDVADLASALGAEQIRLWGISYGTHLGLTVIRRHPDLVERAILAGVEGPDHTVKMPSYWSDQLADLGRLIARDSAADEEFHDLGGLVDSVLDRVERNPPRVEFISADRQDTVRSQVSRFEVERATIDRLRDPDRMVTVPWLYRRMAAGDFSLVARQAPVVGGFDAMPEATDAASGISEERLFRFFHDDRALPLGGGDDLTGAYMADALGIPDLGEAFREPVRSTIPILFISGTLDGRTPPANAEEVLQGFPNGEHLIIDNAGHSDDLFLSSSRIRDVMEEFLMGDSLSTLHLTVPPPELADGRLPPSLSRDLAEEIVGAYERIDGDVWRVVRNGTTRSLGPDGEETGRTVNLFVRIRGNGYPFVADADTTFSIGIFGPGLEFRFPRGPSGSLAAMQLVRSAGDTTRFRKVEWDEVGFIESRYWLMAGPYRPDGEAVCDTPFPPEERARSGHLSPEEGRTAGPEGIAWQAAEGDDGFVNFEETLGGSIADGVGYAYLTVHADTPLDAQIRTGTDDDARILLNGERVHSFDGARDAWAAQDTVPVTFRKGDNHLVVKVCNRDSDWRFNLRITDEGGRSLVTSREPGLVVVAQEAPSDPVMFFHERRDAVRLYESQEWQKAAARLAALTGEYPADAELWFRLGRSRQQLGRFEGAIRAYERGLELGGRYGPWVRMQIARMYASLGAPDSSLHWIDRALAAGWDDRPGLVADTAFRGLRSDVRFRELTGQLPEGELGRSAGWRHDLRYLVEEAHRMHVAAPGEPNVPAAFDSIADELHGRIPELSNDQILTEFRRLVTLLGDGHSGIYGPDDDTPLTFEGGSLPLLLHLFDDGLYVIDAAEGSRRWIGSRVLAFGSLSAEEVIEELAAFIHHDNAMTIRWLGVRFQLPRLPFLHAIGATEGLAAATLTLRDREGAEHRVTFRGGDHLRSFRRKLRPVSGRTGEPPLYLSRVEENYWLQPLPEEDALYFQFNQVRDADDGSTLAGFADSLRRTLVEGDVESLIVDVRHNNGGNNGLLRPLVQTLVWWEQDAPDRRVFVITGRNTFSAAQNFVNRVERWTDAVFVGEPTSSRPNFAGEETNLLLPYSRVRGSISNRYWQDSDQNDRRPWIAPDMPVGFASDDYFDGRDPALEAILTLLEDQK